MADMEDSDFGANQPPNQAPLAHAARCFAASGANGGND